MGILVFIPIIQNIEFLVFQLIENTKKMLLINNSLYKNKIINYCRNCGRLVGMIMGSILVTLCAKSRMLSSHLTAVGLYSKIIFNEKAIFDVFLRTLAQHCTSRPADTH